MAEDGGHGDGGVGRPTEAEHPHHHDHLGCQSLVIASAKVFSKVGVCVMYIVYINVQMMFKKILKCL